MPEQLIKVRPTKIEFIRLKRRLSLAERVQKIMKELILVPFSAQFTLVIPRIYTRGRVRLFNRPRLERPGRTMAVSI